MIRAHLIHKIIENNYFFHLALQYPIPGIPILVSDRALQLAFLVVEATIDSGFDNGGEFVKLSIAPRGVS